MTKKVFVFISVLSAISLLFLITCNDVSKNDEKMAMDLNVLDASDSSRLTIYSTIDVIGSTWDGNGVTIDGTGVDSDEPPPVFRVSNGTLTNVTLDPMGAAGIWLYGNCAVSNVTGGAYKDAGMMHSVHGLISIKGAAGGTSTITNVTSTDLDHAPFQIYTLSTIYLNNITVNHATSDYPMVRQSGGTTWKCVIYLDTINLTNPTHCVVRSESLSTTVKWRNITSGLAQSSWWYGNFIVNTY